MPIAFARDYATSAKLTELAYRTDLLRPGMSTGDFRLAIQKAGVSFVNDAAFIDFVVQSLEVVRVVGTTGDGLDAVALREKSTGNVELYFAGANTFNDLVQTYDRTRSGPGFNDIQAREAIRLYNDVSGSYSGQVLLAGHSLGGQIANIVALDAIAHGTGDRIKSVLTFETYGINVNANPSLWGDPSNPPVLSNWASLLTLVNTAGDPAKFLNFRIQGGFIPVPLYNSDLVSGILSAGRSVPNGYFDLNVGPAITPPSADNTFSILLHGLDKVQDSLVAEQANQKSIGFYMGEAQTFIAGQPNLDDLKSQIGVGPAPGSDSTEIVLRPADESAKDGQRDPATGATLPRGVTARAGFGNPGFNDESGRSIALDIASGPNGPVVVRQRATDSKGLTVESDVVDGKQINANILIGKSRIGFSDAGGVIGQQLGSYLTNNDPLTGPLASAALGTVLDNLGDVLDGLVGGHGLESSINGAFSKTGPELAANLKSAGIGAVSSYLTAELVNAIGVHGFAGAALQTGAGTYVSAIIANLPALLNGTKNLKDVLSGVNIGTVAGAFLGTQLASAIVNFDTVEGQLGASIGSAVGTIAAAAIIGTNTAILGVELGAFAGPIGAFAGAFVGYLLGGVIGSLFAGTPRSGGSVTWDPEKQKFQAGDFWTAKGGSRATAVNLNEAVARTLNGVLAAAGGRLSSGADVQAGEYGQRGKDLVYRKDRQTVLRFKGAKAASDLIDYGVGQALSDPDFAIIGGDVLTKRALYNGLAAAGGAFTTEQLLGDLETAKRYRAYLNHSVTANALLDAESSSVFAAQEALVLARAVELGLTRRAASDWFGGFGALLSDMKATGADTRFRLEYDPLTQQLSRVIDAGLYTYGDTVDVAGETKIGGTAGNDTIDLRGAHLADQRGFKVDGKLQNDIAVGGEDFTPKANATLTFAAADRVKTFTIATIADAVADSGETFLANLSSGTGMTAIGEAATAMIVEGGGAPQLHVSRSYAYEGDGYAVFRVSLSAKLPSQFIVDFDLIDGSATGGGVDYALANDKRVQVSTNGSTWSGANGAGAINPNTTEIYVRVPITADNGVGADGKPTGAEGNETFRLRVTPRADNINQVATGLAPVEGLATILDGTGAAPLVWLDDTVVQEGSNATFTAIRNKTGAAGTVLYGTADRRALDVGVAATVDAGAGDDMVYASDRGDNIVGGAGNDILVGGKLDDWLLGGDGNDRLFAGAVATTAFADTDAASIAAATSADGGNGNLLSGGVGDDRLYGSRGSDWLQGGDGSDILYGGAGGDVLDAGMGNDGADTTPSSAGAQGGAGSDLYVFNRGDGADVYYDDPGNTGLTPGIDSIAKTVQDRTTGALARNWAGIGDYTIDGSVVGGDDAIVLGANILPGDLVIMRSGSVTTPGNDLVINIQETGTNIWKLGDDQITIKDWFEGTHRIEWLRFANGEEVRIGELTTFKLGTGKDDIVVGTSGNDFLYGGDGNDKLWGLAGNDFVNGGAGNDLVSGDNNDDLVLGGTGNDIALGGLGDDYVFGDAGIDTVYGGAGNDVVSGGKGDGDVVVGGAGDDIFKYDRGDGKDTFFDEYAGTWETIWSSGTYVNGYVLDPATGRISKNGAVVFDGANWVNAQYDYVENGTTKELRRLVPPAYPASTVANSGIDTIEFGVGIDAQDLLFSANTGSASLDIAVVPTGGAFDSFSEVKDHVILRDWYAGQRSIEGFQFVNTGRLDVASMNLVGIAYAVSTDNVAPGSASWVTGDERDNLITGSGQNDILNGFSGNDTLRGGDGQDVLYGGSGDDALDGGAGADILVGGAGTDVASYASSGSTGVTAYLGASAYSSGAARDDAYTSVEGLAGGDGADKLYGDDGSNQLEGGAGNDKLFGGTGDDTYVVNNVVGDKEISDAPFALREVVSSSGALNTAQFTFKWISKGKVGGFYTYQMQVLDKATTPNIVYNNASLQYATPQASIPPVASWSQPGSWLFGGGQAENGAYVVADPQATSGIGDAADTLEFGAGVSLADLTATLSGLDIKLAFGADRSVTLKSARTNGLQIETLQLNDGLSANLANLRIGTEATTVADDLVLGTAGNDTIAGQDGNDVLGGGAGNDSLAGGNGDDVIEGGAGNDTLDGGSDSLTLGLPSVVGAPYGDTARFASATGAVAIDLGSSASAIAVTEGGVATDTIVKASGVSTIENLVGSGLYGDTLRGDGRANRLFGLGGDDTLGGQGGDDVIDGGDGNDSIDGGDGNDNLVGGIGNDAIYGGLGNDIIAGGDDGDGTASYDPITYVTTYSGGLHGGDGKDNISGGSGDDYLFGDAGDDTLDGGDGNDNLFGGDGNDVLSGGTGRNYLYGEAGDDTLFATGNADALYGGDGDDTFQIQAGAVNPAAFGGAGDDTFIWDVSANSNLTVVDFQGNNKLVLKGATSDEVWITKSGSSLRIGVLGSTRYLTVYNYFRPVSQSPGRIREIVADDGSLYLKYAGGGQETPNYSGSLIEAMTLAQVGGRPSVMPDAIRARLASYWWPGGKAPPTTTDQALTTAEDTALVGSVAAVDQDENIAANGYTIAVGPTHGTLALSTTVPGTWSYTPAADYNGADSFKLLVTDLDGQTATQAVALTVTPVNDAPAIVLPAPLTIAENSANGTVVGTLVATDVEHDLVAFTLADDGAGGRFAISSTGTITVNDGSRLNFEIATSHTILVKATDSGPGYASSTRAITIGVDGVNERPNQPTIASVPVARISESYGGVGPAVGGTVIATFALSDPDGTIPQLHLRASSQSAFDTSGNQLRFAPGYSPDFETLASLPGAVLVDRDGDGLSEVELTADVETWDGALASYAATTVTVGIEDVNEAPTAITIAPAHNFYVGERDHPISSNPLPPIVVGALGAIDPDLAIAGESFLFSTSDSRFEVVGGTQLQLRQGAALDYETAPRDASGFAYVDVPVTVQDRAGGLGSRSATTNVHVLVLDQVDYFYGTAGNDAGASAIIGASGRDYIYGFSGDDELYGRDGNDALYGSDGNDRLFGENGSDYLYGDLGNDVLSGGNDNDRLYGSFGNDTLNGNAGSDILYGQDGDDVLDGGIEDSSYDYLSGSNGNDTLYGRGGDDYLTGYTGDDLLVGGAGSDQLDGGDGFDIASYEDATASVSVSLANTALRAGDATGDTLINIEALRGSALGDVLEGDANANALSGGGGDDQLFGLAGADTILGEAGNDLVDGGDGNDPQLDGGDGNDTVRGGAGDDLLFGGVGDDTLEGGDGADQLTGGIGNDVLRGGAGNDTYLIVRGDGSDTIDQTGSLATDFDQLGFQGGIQNSNLWFAWAGNDVTVTVMDGVDADSEYDARATLANFRNNVPDGKANIAVVIAGQNKTIKLAIGALATMMDRYATTFGVARPTTQAAFDAIYADTTRKLDGLTFRQQFDNLWTQNQAPTVTLANGGATLTLNEDQYPSGSPLLVHFHVADDDPLTSLSYTADLASSRGLTPSSVPSVQFGAVTVDASGEGTIALTTTPDAGGSVLIRLRATDPGGLPGEARLPVDVWSQADTPIVTAGVVGGNAGVPIALNVSASPLPTNGSEIIDRVEIAGVPAGFSFQSADGSVTPGNSLGNGTWRFSQSQLAGLAIIASGDWSRDLTGAGALQVTAWSRELSYGTGSTDPRATAPSVTRPLGVQINGRPTDITFSGTVPENAPNGTVVGTAAGVDPDRTEWSQPLTYALADDADRRFAIDSSTGVITVRDGTRLDYEDRASLPSDKIFPIAITVTDSGGLAFTKTTGVAVTNVNEAPPTPTGGGIRAVFTETGFGGNPANAGSIVATFGTSDPDGTTPTLEITSNPGGWFTVDQASKTVRFNGTNMDFETFRNTGYWIADHNYGDGLLEAYIGQVRVRANDGALASAETAVDVFIQDVPETPTAPTLTSYTPSFSETVGGAPSAQAGRTIATLSSTDGDGPTPRYTITGGDPGWFTIDGNALKFLSPNFTADWVRTYVGRYGSSAATSYDQDHDGLKEALVATVQVAAYDATGLQSPSIPINIFIEDVNEAPSFAPASLTMTVAENCPANTSVGSLSGTDTDGAPGELRYAFVRLDGSYSATTDDARFAIDAYGNISVNGAQTLNYEAQNAFSYRVVMADRYSGANAMYTYGTLAINLTDVNEAPSVSPASFSIPEERYGAIGGPGFVGQVVGSDPDTGGDPSFRDLQYSIMSGDPTGRFAIDATGKIFAVQRINYDDPAQAKSYSLTVQAKDLAGNGLFATAPVSVSVTPVNEAPTLSTSGSLIILSTSNTGQILGYATASDPDGDALSVTKTDTGADGFIGVNSSGQIFLRYNPRSSYPIFGSFTVTARETNTPEHNQVTSTVNFSYYYTGTFSPILLDLNGDGVKLTSVNNSPVYFDVNADGIPDQTGWVDAQDGMLALDRNGNGKIDSFDEISFAADLSGAVSDLQGLRAFDTNDDGFFGEGDAQYADFRIWQDTNQNGVSDEGELTTLAERGITAINLTLTPTGQVVEGATDNVLYATSEFVRSDGTTGDVGDVFFAYYPSSAPQATSADSYGRSDGSLDLASGRATPATREPKNVARKVAFSGVDAATPLPAALRKPTAKPVSSPMTAATRTVSSTRNDATSDAGLSPTQIEAQRGPLAKTVAEPDAKSGADSAVTAGTSDGAANIYAQVTSKRTLPVEQARKPEQTPGNVAQGHGLATTPLDQEPPAATPTSGKSSRTLEATPPSNVASLGNTGDKQSSSTTPDQNMRDDRSAASVVSVATPPAAISAAGLVDRARTQSSSGPSSLLVETQPLLVAPPRRLIGQGSGAASGEGSFVGDARLQRMLSAMAAFQAGDGVGADARMLGAAATQPPLIELAASVG